MHRFLHLTLGSLLLLASPALTWAQQAAETFGKNRIQYQNFEWSYYSTGNFELYYYQGGHELAEQAVRHLKEEYERITDVLGYLPLTKTKIFLYNSHSDLMQSNIGVNDSYQAVAGETVFVKNVVEIAYPGTLEAFKTELVFQVSSQLLQEMMFGGSLTDMFQKAYLLNLPDWFIPGAARYIAYGWGPRMDDYIRDLVLNGRVRKLDRYQGEEAALLGHSIWNYVAEKYGRSNISSVLNLTRIIRNEERSIANTLGTTFGRFKEGWRSYYVDMAETVLEQYEYPDKINQVTRRNRRNVIRNRVSLSPDGKYLAYSENDRGRYSIMLWNRETDKTETVLRGGYRLLNQQVNGDLPILTWRDSVTLVTVAERRGGPALWIYDIREKEKEVVNLSAFHAIQHVSFNDNGRLMAMSAEEDGRSDIYLVSLRKNVWRKLTDDAYDDEFPEFVPGTNAIIFSSNRLVDTLRSVRLEDVDDDLITFNLFVYNLDTTNTVLSRVTNTLSTDLFPVPISSGEFVYLSDQKGIQNLFRYQIKDSLYTQITNFANSMHAMDFCSRTSEIAFVSEVGGRDYIYLQKIDLDEQRFTLPTARQQRQQAKYLANRILAARARQAEVEAKQETEANIDTESLLDANDYQFGTVEEPPMDPNAPIDTDNYVFNPTAQPGETEEEERSSFLLNYRRLQDQDNVVGPFGYTTRLSTNNLVTSLEIDPLMGWGFSLSTQMNDLLENHRFTGSAFSTPNLASGRIMVGYDYLPGKIDYGVAFSRKTISRIQEATAFHRYSLNQVDIKAAIPHSVSLRTEGALFFTHTRYQDLNPTFVLSPPPGPLSEDQSFIGLRGAVVFDNSAISGMNSLEGTRAKVEIKNYFSLNDPERSFGNVKADIRHYQPLHRNLTLAVRGFYGAFFGPQRQRYMLGGVDNWLFPRSTENEFERNSPLAIQDLTNNREILFTEYVTSLRGFPYNAMNGQQALLGNVELRLPLVRYFYNGPITSNFFRNLQLTAFYDVGSSWTGPSPWSPDSQLNTEVIQEEGSSFRIELLNYNNPWLMSYGGGFRSVILGYYAKFDVAWPVANYRVADTPQLLITVGYDF